MGGTSEPNDRQRAKRTKKKNNHDFFVVGIGASAGGIRPLEQFFELLPPKSDMAFVVILHLSPQHESNLAEMIQRKTQMPVIQVRETVKVEPNRVYVIPPSKHLAMADGYLKVVERDSEGGRRVPIDLFFRSLAQAYNHHSIGVILSGTGTDGTLGLKRIKEDGGISMVQDPHEAEYDGMLRSAIEGATVDFILPVSKMPEKLISIRAASREIKLPPEGDKPPKGAEAEALRDVLTFLRVRTGHDFSNYKQSTVLRRVTRRMQVNALTTLTTYLSYIREHQSEVQDLLSDLLITVTNFFRDADAFNYLEQEVVPKLFARREPGEQVRVWVTGCATGEEAYSLAMLLQECAGTQDFAGSIQIFATDIDEESITQAREGLYPDSISTDVSPERLRHFFNKEGQHYRVKKEIREMVLFAPHNILRDPPFSKLDLVSCRNLLIYLNRETQERVLELFHFALLPGGYLFLGASESADSLPDLFTPVDKKLRVFQRSQVRHAMPYVPQMPVVGKWDVKLPLPQTPPSRQPYTFSDLHQILLEEYAPPSVLVNPTYDIVHLSENAGRYLRFAGGEPSRNLLRAVHPDLRLDLRAALLAASQESRQAETRRVTISLEGETRNIHITVRPIAQPEAVRGFLLVIFDEGDWPRKAAAEAKPEEAPEKPSSEMDAMVRRLEEELQRTKDQLRGTIEQYETSTEELKASNEELQAMNEELRSATEELETSKEELQSVNEELTTVNHELKDKVDEVSRVNSDLQNLMASTDIGTIFLDRELRIKRFTPSAGQLFNIIASDVGRPLTHLTHKLAYENLSEDAAQVLKTLTRVEREVQSADGGWYIARLLPYRTMEDRIDGVVMTFVDITERNQAESNLQSSEERLRMIVESVDDYGIFTLDLEGRVNSWNPGAEKIFGFKEADIIGQPAEILFTPEDRANGVPEKEMQEALAHGRAEDERWHVRQDGARFYASGVMTRLRDGAKGGFVKVLRDLTDRKKIEEELHQAYTQMETRVAERTRELRKEVIDRSLGEEKIQELLRRIVGTQELERQRISRDLHDLLGQQMTALKLSLESLLERVGKQQELRKPLMQMQQIAQQLDSEVDFLAWELRPAMLGEIGLAAALEDFVQEWSKHFGIAADFHAAGFTGVRLSRQVETNLYRIMQEALNNIYKHAAASRVDVILERREKHAVLIIEDNGQGFDPQPHEKKTGKGLGLLSMHERASLVKGTLEIESSPGKGTTIFVRVPLEGGGGVSEKESHENG